MPKRPRSYFLSRRGLLWFAVGLALFHIESGISVFAAGGKGIGRIVTVTAVKGDEQNWIVALDPETSGWEKIAPSGWHARLSPDGTTVAFGVGTGLWTCPLKVGAKPTRIGEIGEAEAMQLLTSAKIAWMPDGKAIIASGARGDFPQFTYETFRFDVNTKVRVKLPVPATDVIDDISADGRWLLTSGTRGPGSPNELFRMRLDGTGEVQLTRGGAGAGRFAPDGKKILYCYGGERAEDEGLFLIDTDGANRRRVHPFPALACWSPDGRRIAFTGMPAPAPPVRVEDAKQAPPAEDKSRFVGHVVLIDLDGKNRVVFPTPTGAFAFQPDWR